MSGAASPRQTLLAFAEALNKGFRLRDRLFHIANQLIHVLADTHQLVLQCTYRLGVQVMLEIQHLILKCLQHWVHALFRCVHTRD